MMDELVDIEVVRRKADECRKEAKQILLRQLGIPEGYSGGSLERLVDLIIEAALLESAISMNRAIKQLADNDN